MKTVLTIAGSDCSGAGGIQSDIKTITAHKLYATSAITSMTAQNTTGVYDIQESVPKFLGRQLDCVFEDIYPDAVKIGMVSNGDLLEVIADKLKKYHVEHMVLDTVIISNNGRRMVGNKAEMVITSELFPMASIVLPSISEAEVLSGITINSRKNMETAAETIAGKYGVKGILLKDGHRITDEGDMLYDDGRIHWMESYDPKDRKTIGKGCVLSAAIACHLAKGQTLYESVKAAREYVNGATDHCLMLGKGRHPLNHTFLFDN